MREFPKSIRTDLVMRHMMIHVCIRYMCKSGVGEGEWGVRKSTSISFISMKVMNYEEFEFRICVLLFRYLIHCVTMIDRSTFTNKLHKPLESPFCLDGDSRLDMVLFVSLDPDFILSSGSSLDDESRFLLELLVVVGPYIEHVLCLEQKLYFKK